MNTIVANVLMREAAKAERSAQPFKVVALFCCVGLRFPLHDGHRLRRRCDLATPRSRVNGTFVLVT